GINNTKGSNKMAKLKLSKYYTAVRAAQYDLLALNELEASRKKKIAPIISVRGNSAKIVESFIEKWGSTPCWVDVSRFPADIQSPLASKLNDPSKNFGAKEKFF